MNARLFSALREIADSNGWFPCSRRMASTKALHEMRPALIHLVPRSRHADESTWRITPAGRAKLAEMEEQK